MFWIERTACMSATFHGERDANLNPMGTTDVGGSRSRVTSLSHGVSFDKLQPFLRPYGVFLLYCFLHILKAWSILIVLRRCERRYLKLDVPHGHPATAGKAVVGHEVIGVAFPDAPRQRVDFLCSPHRTFHGTLPLKATSSRIVDISLVAVRRIASTSWAVPDPFVVSGFVLLDDHKILVRPISAFLGHGGSHFAVIVLFFNFIGVSVILALVVCR